MAACGASRPLRAYGAFGRHTEHDPGCLISLASCPESGLLRRVWESRGRGPRRGGALPQRFPPPRRGIAMRQSDASFLCVPVHAAPLSIAASGDAAWESAANDTRKIQPPAAHDSGVSRYESRLSSRLELLISWFRSSLLAYSIRNGPCVRGLVRLTIVRILDLAQNRGS